MGKSPLYSAVDGNARQPQLDALRAVAVALVICQHTLDPRRAYTQDAGAIGVMVFFVLSGFLITGILMRARDLADASGHARLGVLARFYVRRFLRIFPLYYAVVGTAWLAGQADVRHYLVWLILYGANFLMAGVGGNIGMATPFWSLAVEEQFYLFWPFVVLFCHRRRLRWVLAGMVMVSVIARFLVALTGARENTIVMPTWSELDGFALGGMLAYANHSAIKTSAALRRAFFLGACLVFARIILVGLNRGRPIQMALWMLPWGLVALWFVDQASRDALPALFRSRVLVWLGTISYGMYVYHRPLMTALGVPWRRGLGQFGLISATTAVVATVSWLFFEKPLSDQKWRWPYVRAPAGGAGVRVDANGPDRTDVRSWEDHAAVK